MPMCSTPGSWPRTLSPGGIKVKPFISSERLSTCATEISILACDATVISSEAILSGFFGLVPRDTLRTGVRECLTPNQRITPVIWSDEASLLLSPFKEEALMLIGHIEHRRYAATRVRPGLDVGNKLCQVGVGIYFYKIRLIRQFCQHEQEPPGRDSLLSAKGCS